MHVFITTLMKKILIVLTLFVTLAFSAQAQLVNFGVRAGAGMALHVDNLSQNTPILGANLGGFVTFGFSGSQSMLAENIYLQTGLNLIRRGTKFIDVLEAAMSIRDGFYHAWYVQLPVTALFRYEMPLREPGHYALLSIGPAVSYGLFGTMDDRKVTRGLPQEDWNYHKIEPVFDNLDRLDVNWLFGVGYEYQDLSVMLQLDYGFLAVDAEPDALKTTTENNSDNRIVSLGNNFALLLTVGYQFPVR